MTCIHLTQDEEQYIFDNINEKSTKEIAEWIGCTVGTVNYHLRKKGMKPKYFSKWSPARKQELLELRKQGATIDELAERFGVSRSSIFGQIRKMREKGIKVPTEWYVRLVKKGLLDKISNRGIIMENSLEKINRKYGAQIRGRMGVDKGNDFIRSLAEKVDGVKYPMFGREND